MVLDEKKLIRRAQEGDLLAFVQIHDRYFWRFYRFFYYRVSDMHQAESLTSDLFLWMIEEIGFYKPGHPPFSEWLYLLAGQMLAAQEHPGPNMARHPKLVDGDTALKQALESLLEDQRELIIGRFIEGRPGRIIADAIGRSPHALISLQREGLEALQTTCWGAECVKREKDRKFDVILDEALRAVQAGAKIEEMAVRFSDEKDRLIPLLSLARQLQTLPEPHPDPTAQMNSKRRMLRALSNQKAASRIDRKNILEDLGAIFLQQRVKGVLLVIFAIVIFFILFSSVGVASSQALPGTWLYPVKLTLQEIHIILNFNPQSRQALVDHYQAQRQVDLEKAIEKGLISEDESGK